MISQDLSAWRLGHIEIQFGGTDALDFEVKVHSFIVTCDVWRTRRRPRAPFANVSEWSFVKDTYSFYHNHGSVENDSVLKETPNRLCLGPTGTMMGGMVNVPGASWSVDHMSRSCGKFQVSAGFWRFSVWKNHTSHCRSSRNSMEFLQLYSCYTEKFKRSRQIFHMHSNTLATKPQSESIRNHDCKPTGLQPWYDDNHK